MPGIETNLLKGGWPKIPLIYEGAGRLELVDPGITIKGKAKAKFDRLGDGVACIECDEICFSNQVDRDLIQLFKRNSLSVPEFYKLKPLLDQISNNVIKEFVVKSSNGIFSLTTDNLIYSHASSVSRSFMPQSL
jgi:hypothetical protein